jgi:hypothetical protein
MFSSREANFLRSGSIKNIRKLSQTRHDLALIVQFNMQCYVTNAKPWRHNLDNILYWCICVLYFKVNIYVRKLTKEGDINQSLLCD